MIELRGNKKSLTRGPWGLKIDDIYHQKDGYISFIMVVAVLKYPERFKSYDEKR
tara:strand:+ start:380 stop:541 length:162 start_codon:yes stop_codon:yes gene_type:complete